MRATRRVQMRGNEADGLIGRATRSIYLWSWHVGGAGGAGVSERGLMSRLFACARGRVRPTRRRGSWRMGVNDRGDAHGAVGAPEKSRRSGRSSSPGYDARDGVDHLGLVVSPLLAELEREPAQVLRARILDAIHAVAKPMIRKLLSARFLRTNDSASSGFLSVHLSMTCCWRAVERAFSAPMRRRRPSACPRAWPR